MSKPKNISEVLEGVPEKEFGWTSREVAYLRKGISELLDGAVPEDMFYPGKVIEVRTMNQDYCSGYMDALKFVRSDILKRIEEIKK